MAFDALAEADIAVGAKTEASRLHAWAIPTDEELLIARDTFRVVTGAAARF